jgi:hypothetical protein
MTWVMVAKKIAAKLHGRLSERPHLIPSPETGDTSTKGLTRYGTHRRLARLRLHKSGKSRTINDAGWSSLVARRAHNPKVVSSNLTPATMGA